MAEVVDEMPPPIRLKGGKYAQFFDGQVWKLTQEDFEGKTATSTRSCLISAAWKAGFTVVTSVRDGCLYVQARKKP